MPNKIAWVVLSFSKRGLINSLMVRLEPFTALFHPFTLKKAIAINQIRADHLPFGQ
ncbi:hypothetical protein TR2A62_0624 [Thalassobium sp. R2A62]|nr:hypothetical protein TR2A62_0624 [Thalassobium sp. R2A62]